MHHCAVLTMLAVEVELLECAVVYSDFRSFMTRASIGRRDRVAFCRTPAADCVQLRRGDVAVQLRGTVTLPAGGRREFFSAAVLGNSCEPEVSRISNVLLLFKNIFTAWLPLYRLFCRVRLLRNLLRLRFGRSCSSAQNLVPSLCAVQLAKSRFGFGSALLLNFELG